MLVWAGPLDAVLQSENLNNSDTYVVSGKYIYLQSEVGGLEVGVYKVIIVSNPTQC